MLHSLYLSDDNLFSIFEDTYVVPTGLRIVRREELTKEDEVTHDLEIKERGEDDARCICLDMDMIKELVAYLKTELDYLEKLHNG